MTQMLSAFLVGPGRVEVRAVPVPEPGPGEALVRVRACGICGSDLHLYRRQIPSLPNLSPGHEFAGEVTALGSVEEGWSVGQRVVAEPHWVCRQCAYCCSGRYQLCPQHKAMGFVAPGAMAQYVVVPTYSLYPLPDALDWELGALVEPLAVAVHGLHLAGLAAGERVLVLGSGALGLMVVLAAREAGAEIMTTYRYHHQGEAALAVGAHQAFAADKEGTRALVREAGRGPFDVVVETVGGQADTLAQAMNLVSAGGRIVILGIFTQATSLNGLSLVMREVRILGSNTYCQAGPRPDFDVALTIIAAAPDRARRAISHRFPLAQAPEAFAAAAAKDCGSLKVQVNP